MFRRRLFSFLTYLMLLSPLKLPSPLLVLASPLLSFPSTPLLPSWCSSVPSKCSPLLPWCSPLIPDVPLSYGAPLSLIPSLVSLSPSFPCSLTAQRSAYTHLQRWLAALLYSMIEIFMNSIQMPQQKLLGVMLGMSSILQCVLWHNTLWK